jgi:hypothetical protein
LRSTSRRCPFCYSSQEMKERTYIAMFDTSAIRNPPSISRLPNEVNRGYKTAILYYFVHEECRVVSNGSIDLSNFKSRNKCCSVGSVGCLFLGIYFNVSCLDAVGKKPCEKRRKTRSFQCEKERKPCIFLTGC